MKNTPTAPTEVQKRRVIACARRQCHALGPKQIAEIMNARDLTTLHKICACYVGDADRATRILR